MLKVGQKFGINNFLFCTVLSIHDDYLNALVLNGNWKFKLQGNTIYFNPPSGPVSQPVQRIYTDDRLQRIVDYNDGVQYLIKAQKSSKLYLAIDNAIVRLIHPLLSKYKLYTRSIKMYRVALRHGLLAYRRALKNDGYDDDIPF